MYNQITNKFQLNINKAIATLLYVSQQVNNLYNIMKVLYFADKEHLSKYGRFIYGETYIAMKSGQVPSKVYDIIKNVRGDGTIKFEQKLKELIKVENEVTVKPIAKANLDYLSQSEIECLNNSIKKFGKSHHILLFRKSHKDSAYKETPLNSEITVEKIVNSLDNKEKVKSYLETQYN